MPTPIVLLTPGTEVSAQKIVEAWTELRRLASAWLPHWFAAEIIQDIMQYLLDERTAESVFTVMQVRMAIGGHQLHVEIIESVAGRRRVFIAPATSNGFPDPHGINVYWRGDEGQSEMLMDVY